MHIQKHREIFIHTKTYKQTRTKLGKNKKKGKNTHTEHTHKSYHLCLQQGRITATHIKPWYRTHYVFKIPQCEHHQVVLVSIT